MIELLHPGAIYLTGAVAVAVAPARATRPLVLLVPLAALAAVAALPDGTFAAGVLAGHELQLLRVDAWSRIFALAFALIGALAALYALHVRGRGAHTAAFAYAGSALGAVFAGDLITLFACWEAMAVASTFLILQRGTAPALAAALRYLLVHAFGGTCLLAGIVLHVTATGSTAFEALPGSMAGALVLIGFAVNAAIPPLNAWLTDAYPEATVTGAVFLSALTTKTAVYALARGFPGVELLVWAGVAMALYGVVFAVLENDIRRLLGYHIVSQVGYMVCGIGLGTPLALAGAAAHAFCHILYKGLLFMGTGSVLHVTGRSRLTALGGIGRLMPWTLACYAVGAFSISGVPLFNGFVSKSLVVAAAEHEHRVAVEWLLTLASIGTFLHTGLKLPWFTFFAERRGLRAADPPMNMRLAMAAAAALCILIGVVPALLYRWLPFPVDYAPYTADHVLESLQLLAGTAIGFVWLLSKLGGEPTATLDTDWFYRRAAALLMRASEAGGVGLSTVRAAAMDAGTRLLDRTLWVDRGRGGPPGMGARVGGWVMMGLVLLAGLVMLLA